MNENTKKKIANIFTQEEIAALMGTKQQNISRWFNGRVPAERVIPICELLGWEVTPHELRPDIHPTLGSGLPAGITLPLSPERSLNNENQPRDSQ
jgi:DNA-binding transcriptional regulator YdaS (Cro superfamily)